MNAMTFLETITLLSIVKLMILMLLSVYAVFAYLMMRQIRSMNRAVNVKDDFVIGILGTGHFVFALLVLFIALLVL
jgi:hypothetical protein